MRQIVSSGSVKAISIDREEVLKVVREVARDLKSSLPWVRGVYLFGSFATGQEHGLSDIDLIVVVERIGREDFWQIYTPVFDFLAERLPIGFDLIVLPEGDFKERKGSFSPVVKLAG